METIFPTAATPAAKPFTWRDVKAITDVLTEGQLDMPAVFSIADVKDGVIAGISLTDEDHYTEDEFIQPESSYEPGYVEERELELTYRKGQPVIDID